MDYMKVTLEYYAKWLDVDIGMMSQDGVFLNRTVQRDQRQAGYSDAFDIYIFAQKHNAIISYGTRAEKLIDTLKSYIGGIPDVNDLCTLIDETVKKRPKHNIKYVFAEPQKSDLPIKKIAKDDYGLYLQFFKTLNPGCTDTDWLREYFDGMCDKGFCHAYARNGIFVSVTDAPSMPYMPETVQEIGINTLSEYRGRGYAKAVCTSCIDAMLSNGICPQWSTTSDNVASRRLAASVGFDELAHVITVTL